MPTKAFEVIVGVSGDCGSDEVAIAAASSYLSYADQTDTFGYFGDLRDVQVFGGSGDVDYGIALSFVTRFVNDDEHKLFMDEMARLSRVETVEEISME